VTYGGGCKEHKFELYQKETYLRNFEPVELYLTHESNSDSCEALITKPLAFDISSILEKDPVEITVHGTNGNSIEIERHVNITDTLNYRLFREKDLFFKGYFNNSRFIRVDFCLFSHSRSSAKNEIQLLQKYII
jgi:hypothetical protein